MAAAGAVPGPRPDTAGLQALTGAMDKLEALLRSREAQSNSAGTSLLSPMCPAQVLVGALGHDEFSLLVQGISGVPMTRIYRRG